VSIEDNSDIAIIAVTKEAFNSWIVYGDVRYLVERDYQAAMKGRWPAERPVYRIIARRKAA
jgi:hypothetical protein